MAICWSFATILVLTLIALVTFTQPIFQAPDSVDVVAVVLLDSTNFEESLVASKARSSIHTEHHFPEMNDQLGTDREQREWASRTRKLIQRDGRNGCNEWPRDCRNKPKGGGRVGIERASSPGALTAKEILANYRLPRRSVAFQSDRMVPTGPNPLHNSNRSESVYP